MADVLSEPTPKYCAICGRPCLWYPVGQSTCCSEGHVVHIRLVEYVGLNQPAQHKLNHVPQDEDQSKKSWRDLPPML